MKLTNSLSKIKRQFISRRIIWGTVLFSALIAAFWGGVSLSKRATKFANLVYRPPNLILISMDTVRPDHMSVYGYTQETTPNVKRLAERGSALFQNHIAESTWTLPSHLTLLTGMPQSVHGMISAEVGRYLFRKPINFTLPEEIPTLPEILQREGYKTIGFWDSQYPHLNPSFGFSRGFDFTFPFGLADEKYARMIQEILSHQDKSKPFFTFIHTNVAHWPYFVPGKFVRFAARKGWNCSWENFAEFENSKFKTLKPLLMNYFRFEGSQDITKKEFKREFEAMMNGESFSLHAGLIRLFFEREAKSSGQTFQSAIPLLYDDAIYYADFLVGIALEGLANANMLENTIIAIVSDHGEALWEDQRYGHHFIHPAVMKTAFVLIDPTLKSGIAPIKGYSQNFDVVPTLLSRLRINSTNKFFGKDLSPLLTGSKSEVHEEVFVRGCDPAQCTNFFIQDSLGSLTYNTQLLEVEEVHASSKSDSEGAESSPEIIRSLMAKYNRLVQEQEDLRKKLLAH